MTVPKFKKFKIEAYKPGKSNIGKLKKIIKRTAGNYTVKQEKIPCSVLLYKVPFEQQQFNDT